MTTTPPAFYMNVQQAPTHSVYEQIRVSLNSPDCERALRPLVIAAQVADLANSARVLKQDPRGRETDPWTRHFAGRNGRSVFGIAVGMAVLDAIKLRLTAHSRSLRCAVLGNQLLTNINAIDTSH